MQLIDANSNDLATWLDSLLARREADFEHATSVARAIANDVRARGDVAVSDTIARVDRLTIEPSELLVTPRRATLNSELEQAVAIASDRIERFHAPQRLDGYEVTVNGSRLAQRITPLERVAIYVPGGKAIYLSTLLMCAIPARLAGVRDIVVITTPAATERDELHAVCAKLRIAEIYSGGVAGIAAAAFGTQSLRRADKIVGPGNAYVTAMKQLLVGRIGIDMTAGPTEIIVIADDSADVDSVAADLLAQAEHGDDSSSICITTSRRFAERLANEIASRNPLPKSIERSNGAIVIAGSMDGAVSLANRIGPEHVSIDARDARDIADRITAAGAIYVGRPSAVALGDYVAGSNHVLPTAGSARFFSPLGVYDFLRRSNVVELAADDAGDVASDAATIARFEGLPLHAASVELRESRAEVRR